MKIIILIVSGYYYIFSHKIMLAEQTVLTNLRCILINIVSYTKIREKVMNGFIFRQKSIVP